ncbi:MAG TPA: 4Fe-4S binding protein, partial [Deferrisomatales bacterium]|nr:4Fe-4S binding protein [Deferrisomatales bacterium]
MHTPLLGRLLRSPFLQRTLQLALLAGTLALVAIGAGLDGIPGVPELHPRMYTHATTLLFWVVWLMGLVFLAPLAARAWCGVCPLGFVTDVLGRRGLGLRWPRWLQSGWATVGLFGVGVAAVVGFEAHRSPHRTALLIAAAVAVAVISALVWRRSGFCRGLCPVGSVLHLYSRCAPLRVAPVQAPTCRECRHAGCVSRRREWRRWDLGRWVIQRQVSRGGCPVALYPPAMDTGACLLCLRCVRSCPEGNLGLYLGGGAEHRPLDAARLGALVAVLGLVGYALSRTWPALQRGLALGVDPGGAVGGVWLVVGVPLLLVCAPGATAAWVRRVRGQTVPQPGGGAKPAPSRAESGEGKRRLGAWVLPLVGPLLGAHAA